MEGSSDWVGLDGSDGSDLVRELYWGSVGECGNAIQGEIILAGSHFEEGLKVSGWYRKSLIWIP